MISASRSLAVSISLVLALAFAACGVPGVRAEVDISVGNYWTYDFDGTFQGLNASGEITYKVVEMSETEYVLELSGSGQASGEMYFPYGYSVDGDLAITGSTERLRSNFSQVKSTIVTELSLNLGGSEITASFGLIETAVPSIDDYIGDDNLTEGTVVVSTAEAQVDLWFEVIGFNNTSTATETTNLTMEVLEVVQVTVPAGTFDCYKVRLTIDNGSSASTEFMYYATEVGYYVKIEGSNNSEYPLSSLELAEYSYGSHGGDDTGILSTLIDNWWVLAILGAVVVVLVAVALLMKPKKSVPAPYMRHQPVPPQPP